MLPLKNRILVAKLLFLLVEGRFDVDLALVMWLRVVLRLRQCSFVILFQNVSLINLWKL